MTVLGEVHARGMHFANEAILSRWVYAENRVVNIHHVRRGCMSLQEYSAMRF